MGIERGCLVLADITGYTEYLRGVELEHSHDILADILSVVVEQLTGQLILAKLEGDAVFCHAPVPDEEPPDPALLVTLVEGTYFAFQRRLQDIQHVTTCTCDACRRIPDLSLKFLLHHGAYVVHEVVGNRELVGPDVVLAHRLLKNSVTERTGLHGYALFSEACTERFGIEPVALEMTEHVESFEGVGEVRAFAHDLERRWDEERRRSVVYLEPGAALIEFEAELPAPPPVVWDWLTAPTKRVIWQAGTDRVDQENPRGVPGVGSRNHCVHGGEAVVEHILDWRPFSYVSDRSVAPWGTAITTIELVPLDEARTRVIYRLHPEDMPADLPEEQRAALREQISPMVVPVLDQGMEVIRSYLAASPG
ncbi:MAG: DUF2652 domain-containing protein [Actinobacteria bacterium]|nr:DUF2652 domain-containing protein [Actinomycetota bacterium]